MRRRRAALLLTLSASALAVTLALTIEPTTLRPWIALRHPDVRWISSEGLAVALASDAPPLVLDARTEAEVAVSTIESARRIDPDPDEDVISALPRDRAIVVYCSIGWRSAVVAERLRASGHQRVRNLEGGIFAWANEGRPVWREGEPTVGVHPFDAVWGLLLRSDRRATSAR